MGLPCWLIVTFQKLTNDGVWAFPPGILTPVPGLPDWLYSLGQVAACSAITASTPLWTYLFGNTGATPK